MFDEVIGQKDVQQRLLQMVDERRLPHALMLCGPAGYGPLALAVGLARLLLASGDGQQTANNQAMLAKLEHPDLHFTYPTIKLPSMKSDYKPVSDDFARPWNELVKRGLYFTMTDWLQAIGAENQQAIITAGESDALLRKLSLKSSQGGYKVSIVWLPERMNLECANKILKLLEEPPTRTVFIMVSEEPDKLLETIRSRVQRIDVRRISDDDIVAALTTRRGLTDDTARRTARRANGNWLSALELLSANPEQEEFLELFQTLMRRAWQTDVRAIKQWSEAAAAMGREKQRRFLSYFLRLVRENFAYNFGSDELCYMSQGEEDFARNFARFINENNVIDISELVNRAWRDIGQNANAKIVFFHLALQMIVYIKKAQ